MLSRAPNETIAIMYIGNSGAGKSTLLNKLGGDFVAGVSWRKGVTQSVSEQWVNIKGESVLLIDVPGLFEPKDEDTKNNARMLTEALRRGYRYNLTFVLKASNRGFEAADLLMMSKVNEYVRGLDGSKVTYKMIINQIMDDAVYNMYNETVVKDNFKSQFAELEKEGYHFDIKINSVLLLRHHQDFVRKGTSKELEEFEYNWRRMASIQVKEDIFASIKELSTFETVLGTLFAFTYAAVLGAGTVVVSRTPRASQGAILTRAAIAYGGVSLGASAIVVGGYGAYGAFLLFKRIRE
ncbi:hypothetical protein DFQ27_004001 [Actinomortierella ambigua]|uniref:G domain-containing protein n=1 Tax=Actinomortierella ambigua TaxID=1343610 RepID=A0A9P6QHX5_9FUNG|nr:hypothetical protein DFQ27_004001 [Actinomortierella ambigua]